MTTVLHRIDAEELEAIVGLMGMFLHGECYAFAIALSRGTGWPMVGIMRDGVILHAGVRSASGVLYDARGYVSNEEFAAPFAVPGSYTLVAVTDDMLRAMRPVSEMGIGTASKMAQARWPDLPWRDAALKSRVEAFADALEKLSREHGLWIRGAVPGSHPVIAFAGDDEGGYALRPTGLTYTIDRYLVRNVRQ